MTIQEMNDNYGLPGVLAFDEHEGLVRAQVTSEAAKATVYLHGAHITDWQPTGSEPVLYLSPKTDLAPEKAIRGGVPVCFPWFGPRSDGGTGPSHGFARIQAWDLAFAALAGEDLHLTFTLGPNELSRSLGFDHFRVAYQMVIGKSLTLKFMVVNDGTEPMKFEEALHTYFAVPDVRTVSITGLEGASYIDKTDGLAVKTMPETPFVYTSATDRVYPGHTAACTIAWPGGSVTNTKVGSKSTVVWNPWEKAVLSDLPAGGWEHFACVETANALADAVTLAPGESHTMEMVVTV